MGTDAPRPQAPLDVRHGGLWALLAAALFGSLTPAAKGLLAGAEPQMLAALFYLGSGVGVAGVRLARRSQARLPSAADLPWLLGSIVCGGVTAPLLLLVGLQTSAGSAASLLLTTESLFTALIAWMIFREAFSWRSALGMSLLTGGAAVLAIGQGASSLSAAMGLLAVGGACVAWSLDNNLVRQVKRCDPMTLTAIKGLTAGTTHLILAVVMGATAVSPGTAALAGLVGFVCFGLSFVCFVRSIRLVGAARAGAYIAAAPFIGAALSAAAFREPITATIVAAGVLMAAGIWINVTEKPRA